VSAVDAFSLEPFFMDGASGRLFALEVAPARPREVELALLVCPPFAEELNRVRRAVQLAARRLARRGVSVLLLDLYGTGDSEGEFVEARWDRWRADLECAASWLRSHRCERVALWGVRLGALLAFELARAGRYEQLLLWQPVIRGSLFLTQFLRLRVAADMLAADGASNVAALRAQLAAGTTVEIAGYEITPALAQAIDASDLGQPGNADLPPIDWLEAIASEGRPPAAASRALLEGWQAAGIEARLHVAVAQQFWGTPEIVVPETFIEATDRIGGSWVLADSPA
jgi:exosortase A-associated hydrolase 2